MYFNKKLLLVFILLIFVSIGGVCANNVSNTSDNSLNTDIGDIQDDSPNLNDNIQISNDLNQISQEKLIVNPTNTYLNDNFYNGNITPNISEDKNFTQNMPECPDMNFSISGNDGIGNLKSDSFVNVSGCLNAGIDSNSTNNTHFTGVNSNNINNFLNIGSSGVNYYYSSNLNSNSNNHYLNSNFGDNLHFQNPLGFLFASDGNFGFNLYTSINTEMNDNMGLYSAFNIHFKILNVSKNYTVHSDANIFCNYLMGLCSGLFQGTFSFEANTNQVDLTKSFDLSVFINGLLNLIDVNALLVALYH